MDPVVYFFLLGVLAVLVRSDLRLPPALYEALSIYLLISIGLKGGVELAKDSSPDVVPQALVAIAFSAGVPLLLYPVLRRVGRFGRPDSASIAAHYGSVSVVTFAVAQATLAERGIAAENSLPLLVALMEAPAIVTGIVLARTGLGGGLDWRTLAHEVLTGRSVLLLLGGLAIGAAIGPSGITPLEPVFVDPFKGVLALFLLEMGLVAGSRLGELRRAGPFLAVFGLVTPVVMGSAGAVVGTVIGMSVGGAAVLGTLVASASYIAAPTAMRVAVPEANPALSIGAVLGVTFPFNVVLGIPLYIAVAQALG